MRACLLPVDLARVARGEKLQDADDMRHAAECAVCSEQIVFLRRCLAIGAEDIDAEIAEVVSLLEDLEQSAGTPLRWWRVVHEKRFQKPSLARRLIGLAFDARQKNTTLALGYSTAATRIVEALAAKQDDIADLRFDVWRHHVWLLREFGRYDECRQAFVKAEEAAMSGSDPELSRAVIQVSRALLDIEPDVWLPKEGEALLESAEKVFARRDPYRLFHARTARGMLASRAGDHETAAAIFAEVVALIPRQDEAAYADALRNLSWSEIHAGRAADDIRERVEALETLDERYGNSLNVLRDRWMRGLLDLATGRSAEAVALLRDTMRAFETTGDLDTAIRIGVDALRALLSSDRHGECLELARDLASRAIGLDMRERSRRRTLTAEAMTYLRDAAQLGSLTGDIAQCVGSYVDRITSQRPAEFVPPMPLQRM